MKSFEEEFPSLKDKCHVTEYGELTQEVGYHDDCWVILSDIKESCLDKQKVKDAIIKILNKKRPEDEFIDGYRFKAELLKELRLDQNDE